MQADYCKCPTPECRVCGLVVRDQRQPAEGIIEEVGKLAIDANSNVAIYACTL